MKKKALRLIMTIVLALIMTADIGWTSSLEENEMRMFTSDEISALGIKFAANKLTATLKPVYYDAPVMIQRFGADPFAMVYDGRVYLYMTGDVLETDGDGKAVPNTYSRINTINVVSSSDLINWTDHGCIVAAGKDGAAKWGGNSWAPAAACKEIDGQMRFFLYFANGGNGIGVLVSDNPAGPFTDPLGKALISRSTPNCANVEWLFDPAVFVDDDGSAYIYFGGGVPAGKTENPGTGRVCKLGDDMISLDGTPVAFDIPYLFEDSGINRIGDKYVYSYCTNWQVSPEAKQEYGFDNAQIAYMVSDHPMGPFEYAGVILKNPGTYYGCYGNNHHCMFEFNGEWYIAYHTQILEGSLGISGGYRSTSISKIKIDENGSIATIQIVKRDSLKQSMYFNPFTLTSAATMCTNGGITTKPVSTDETCGRMMVSDISSGDWIALRGVDFEDGAASVCVTVRLDKAAEGAIQIRLDSAAGEVIGYVVLPEKLEGDVQLSSKLFGNAQGIHNLFFVFAGEGYELIDWQFSK